MGEKKDHPKLNFIQTS